MPTPTHPRRLVAGAVVAAVAAVPAVAVAAQPSKDGALYAQARKGTSSIAVTVAKKRITGASGQFRLFKHGKACRPPGAKKAGPFTASAQLKHSVKVSSSGAFSFSVTAASTPRMKLTVSGKFTSGTRGHLSVRGSYKGCTGGYSSNKAAIRQFG